MDNPEWFRTDCVCAQVPGCGWSERPLECLFADYLPDINWTLEEVQNQFIDDAVYWVDEYNVDGFRVDAVKHVETTAIYNLRAALQDRFEQGGHRIMMFGETAVGQFDQYSGGCGIEYDDGYAWISGYTGSNALDGQFDFPTYHRMKGMLYSGSSLAELPSIYADLINRYKASDLHVRFIGSHDNSRMISRADSNPYANCKFLDESTASLPTRVTDPSAYGRMLEMMVMLYSLPGIPLLYYGDEWAMAGGNDPTTVAQCSSMQMVSPRRMGSSTV